MSSRKVAIWGASGHAMVIADAVRLAGEYRIAGFLDDLHPDRRGAAFCDARILGGREQLSRLRDRGVEHIIVAVGDCRTRLRLAAVARQQGLTLARAVHPKATVAADVTLGPGSVVMAGAVINSGSRIGENVIVNTSASVDHECVLEDGVHVCPGVHLGGNVHVGRATQLGIGSSAINGIRIGAGTLIGAGAVVVDNVPDEVLAYGVPARVVKRQLKVA